MMALYLDLLENRNLLYPTLLGSQRCFDQIGDCNASVANSSELGCAPGSSAAPLPAIVSAMLETAVATVDCN